MNRDEIAKELSKDEYYAQQANGYGYSLVEHKIIDLVLSEIAAAEKRGYEKACKDYNIDSFLEDLFCETCGTLLYVVGHKGKKLRGYCAECGINKRGKYSIIAANSEKGE